MFIIGITDCKNSTGICSPFPVASKELHHRRVFGFGGSGFHSSTRVLQREQLHNSKVLGGSSLVPPRWRQAYTIEVPIFYPATSMFVPCHTLDGWAASANAWYVHPRLWDLKTSTSFATIFRISFQCNSEAHWMPLSKLRDWETPGQLRRSPSILCWFGVNGSCNWMSMYAKVMQLKSLCPCRVWFSIVCQSMACETPKDAILKFSSVRRNAMTARTACFRRVPQNGLTGQGQKAMTSDAWETKNHNSWRCFPTFRRCIR